MERAIEKTLGLLISMPKPPSTNPLQEVSSLLSEFAKDVSRHVDGIPDAGGVIQNVRRVQEDFQHKILQSCPAFRPYERQKEGITIYWTSPAFLSKEEGDNDYSMVDSGEVIYVDDVFDRALR